MKLFMTGIDFTRASIETREKTAFVHGQIEKMLPVIRKAPAVSGCVLLATCNRTELYLHSDGAEVDAFEILCNAAGLDVTEYRDISISRQDQEAIRHLFSVAAGLKSQIFGDGQILSQVRDAQALSRNAGTSDALLDTLFRRAVTAGKRVRTSVRLTGVPASAAEIGIRKAEAFFGSLKGKCAVVIGNGAMGRLASSGLKLRGADVTVTLRTYRHGETIVSSGCSTWPYDKRYDIFSSADLIVSATTSPHYTVTAEKIHSLARVPTLMIDLAVPRDIEQSVGGDGRVTVWNLDDIGGLGDYNAESRRLAETIICEEETEFYRWFNYRQSLPVIGEIKDAALARVQHDRIYAGLAETDDTDGIAELAVSKTVDLLFGSMKGEVNPEMLTACLERIRKNSIPKHTGDRLPSLPPSEDESANTHKTQKDAVKKAPAANRRFPVFLSLAGRKCIVFGAGKIAERRAGVLKRFGAQVTVIAPESRSGLEADIQRGFEENDLDGVFLAVAATNNRETNSRIARACAEKGILCSTADSASESAFFFPAICEGQELTAGVVSMGKSHRKTAEAAKRIRVILEEIDGTDKNRQP